MNPCRENARLAVLKKATNFSALTADDISRLADLGTELGFKAGDFILWEGDAPDYFFVVIEGRVKIVKQSSGGRDFIIAFFEPGEMFGEAAAFQNRPYPASAQAANDCLVLRFKKQDFAAFLGGRPEAALGIINMLSGRLRELQSRLKDLASERVEQRIATVLLLLSSRLGADLPFTRQDIAAMAGTTTETAIRVIGHLKERGIVGTGRGKIAIVDSTKLRVLSEGPPI